MSQSKNKINDGILKLYGKIKEEELEIPQFYIGYKTKKIKGPNNTQTEIIVEQYGKITLKMSYSDNKNRYLMDYGHYNFHESILPIEQIRKLTKKELKHHENNEYWNLPQNFYQS
tara:strand:- start:6579 stop:6923 length:345 start_codon:yes stop_codon:yes gene_type:complete